MEGSSSSFLLYRGSFPPRYWVKRGIVTPTQIARQRLPLSSFSGLRMNVPTTYLRWWGHSLLGAFLCSKYPFLIELPRKQHPLYVPVGYFALSDSSGGLLRTQRSLSRRL